MATSSKVGQMLCDNFNNSTPPVDTVKDAVPEVRVSLRSRPNGQKIQRVDRCKKSHMNAKLP